MTPALASLLALLAAIVVSCTSRLNVGLLSIALAWIIGVYYAGIGAEAIAKTFPSSLFLTLAGVTLLFSLAETNGTLGRLAGAAVALTRGSGRLLPVVLFGIALVISSLGPGAISTVALLVPLAMAMGREAGIPPFLSSLMVATGANAGNLSPISAVGIIANTKMAEVGLGGHEAKVWFANLASHVLVAAAAYFGLGGHRIPRRPGPDAVTRSPLDRAQLATLVGIGAWIAGLVFFKLPVGLSAFGAAVLLILVRAGDESAAIRRIPWGIVMMVSGVSVLVALLEATGGMDLFTTLLSKASSPATINGAIAFVTGAISTYSSTSGVVLPAFLPTATKVVEKLGGGDPLAVALSINVGSALVDVSPLSTLGALCVAQLTDEVESRRLFRRLLVWGLSMTVVGALLCQLFAGWLARLGR
jgi:di/tricarboxylate transporter